MDDINWFVSTIVGALLSIPVGIFVNLNTNRFQKWLDNQALSARNKKLDEIKREYQRAKEMHENPRLLDLKTLKTFISGVSAILIFLVFSSFAVIIYLSKDLPMFMNSSVLVAGFAVCCLGGAIMTSMMINSALTSSLKDIAREINYSTYESNAIAQIEQLESESQNSTKGR